MTQAPLTPEDLIEWRDMPPPGAICAVCGASILRRHPWHKTTRPPTRWVCGPCFSDMNGNGPDPNPVLNSAIETDPLPVENPGDPDDQVTPSEEPLARAPRLRSSIEPVPIGIGDLSIDIANVRGRWYVGIYQAGTMIAEVQFSTNPIHAKGVAGKVAEETKRAIPHIDRAMVRQATDRTLTALREAGDGAIVADAVARVINSTVKVEREMSDPPAYVIHLDTGDCLEFSNKELAALQPIALNAQWLAVRFESLRATGRDFETIAEHWLSVAVSVDPPGSKSPWEQIAVDLQFAIAAREPGTTSAALLDSCLYQEPGGPLWISNQIIKEVMRKNGKDEADNGLSRFLQRRGDLIETSKTFKVGGVPIRAWGLRPDFMPEADTHNRPVTIDRGGDPDAL